MATPIAHKGALAGAKALSGAVIDLFEQPHMLDEVRRTFKDELAGVTYASLLPEGQQPPAALNKDMMERWREPMRAFYMKERPNFR